MEEKNICKVCGTTLVKSKEDLKMDGSRKLDGSWKLSPDGDFVCPKCHPELVKVE